MIKTRRSPDESLFNPLSIGSQTDLHWSIRCAWKLANFPARMISSARCDDADTTILKNLWIWCRDRRYQQILILVKGNRLPKSWSVQLYFILKNWFLLVIFCALSAARVETFLHRLPLTLCLNQSKYFYPQVPTCFRKPFSKISFDMLVLAVTTKGNNH